MIRIFQIAVLSCTIALLAGCGAAEGEKPVWEGVKLRDITPLSDGKHSQSELLKTMNFSIYVFELPVENISVLYDIWPMLHTQPIRFNDTDALVANSFMVGFGQLSMWNPIADLLREAGGEKKETVSFLLSDGQSRDLSVARLNSKQTVFYISAESPMKAATIGPGEVALRIKAEKISGSRGVCTVDALPVFSPRIISSIPQLAAREKADEVLFTSLGFHLKISPGDFVLLGPERHVSHQVTLPALFFSRAKPKPVVRIYLFACTRIID